MDTSKLFKGNTDIETYFRQMVEEEKITYLIVQSIKETLESLPIGLDDEQKKIAVDRAARRYKQTISPEPLECHCHLS